MFVSGKILITVSVNVFLLEKKKKIIPLCVWYQGVVIFHDVFDNEYNVGGSQIRVEGVYIWPFKQLRMVANR